MRNKTHFPSCAKRVHETAIISENRPFRSLAARTRMSRGQRGQTLGPYRRHAVYYFPSRLGVLQRPHARRTCHRRDIPHSLNISVPLMKEMVFLHVSLSSRVWDRLRSRDSKEMAKEATARNQVIRHAPIIPRFISAWAAYLGSRRERTVAEMIILLSQLPGRILKLIIGFPGDFHGVLD